MENINDVAFLILICPNMTKKGEVKMYIILVK